MNVTPILSTKLQKIWKIIELRLLVLLSLFLQVVLIFAGNRRKYTKSKWVAAILWVFYLSADSVATLALGVLSQAEGDSSNAVDSKYTISVFWAPFLLMHLGGPDTITAYALADNELWSRHLLGLAGQVVVVVYVYIRSFTGAYLNFLWIVIFFAGVVKYGERSWVLYAASRDRYRDSMISRPDPGPNYAKFVDEAASSEEEGYIVSLGKAVDVIPSLPMEARGASGENGRLSDAEVLVKASFFFGTFKKLFADLILSFQDRETSVSYFKTLSSVDAFRIVEIELGLVYDLFYTKSSLVVSRIGIFLRIFSCASTIVAFAAFLVVQNGYPQTEVIITHILLLGAIFLEIYSVLVLLLSDRMMIWLKWDWTTRPETNLPKFISFLYRARVVPARRRWSNLMGQYNVFEQCLKYVPKRGKVSWHREKIDYLRQYLDKYLRWKSKEVEDDLKKEIFDKLMEKVSGRKVDRYWIDQSLKEARCFDENDEIEFDQSILIWHMATDICYHTTDMSQGNNSKREICVLLSNYMVHLMIASPFMLPSGIGQIRLQDTFAEATEFFENQRGLRADGACKKLSQKKAQFRPSEMKGDRSKSLLFDACRLADYLKKPGAGGTWEAIAQVWLDMLMFAAAQCNWSDHAEKLNQGGELLTHVWLLMAHFGMTDQFQISQGYIRAKLELK